ncbi:MAG: class I SAM-dependent methyltransferase, partial [Nitrospira sp.]|nr:class I SAM-dependent methyltransferase [Nitrospira sp.]
HIDGNHDFDRVMDDLRNYVPKLRIGGFLVMDDIDWPAIAPLFKQVKRQMTCVYEASSWGCCRKTGPEIEFHDPRGTVGE